MNAGGGKDFGVDGGIGQVQNDNPTTISHGNPSYFDSNLLIVVLLAKLIFHTSHDRGPKKYLPQWPPSPHTPPQWHCMCKYCMVVLSWQIAWHGATCGECLLQTDMRNSSIYNYGYGS